MPEQEFRFCMSCGNMDKVPVIDGACDCPKCGYHWKPRKLRNSAPAIDRSFVWQREGTA